MEYPTASTLWPFPQPSEDIKNLLNLFFVLADSKEDTTGDRLSEEIFTPDGEFMLAQGTFKGTSELRVSRKDAWATLKTRRHTVLKVYANTADGTDFIVVGNLATTAHDENETNKEFVARVLVEQSGPGPRIRQYRVIVPPSEDSSQIVGIS